MTTLEEVLSELKSIASNYGGTFYASDSYEINARGGSSDIESAKADGRDEVIDEILSLIEKIESNGVDGFGLILERVSEDTIRCIICNVEGSKFTSVVDVAEGEPDAVQEWVRDHLAMVTLARLPDGSFAPSDCLTVWEAAEAGME